MTLGSVAQLRQRFDPSVLHMNVSVLFIATFR